MSSENQEVATPVAQPEQQNSVLSGDPKTETPEVNVDWKQGIPEDIRADKSLESIKDIGSLAKSYIHSQRLVGSDKIPVPNKHATDEDWNAVYEKLGRPKTPGEYKYDIPENANVDKASLNNFSDQAHKLGLLPTQANGMVKFYNEMVSQGIKDADTKALVSRENTTKEMKQEWGQAYDSKLSKAATLAKSIVDKQLLAAPMADGTMLGDHPLMIRAFAMLADKMGEDNIIQASGPAYLTPAQIDKQIGELQQPGSAYWEKRHPNHDAAVQEVQTLLQKKNNEEVV
tara:strand:- start:346 stop:1203 length:858 start_codon:yes stop_codon:yes gene_type:complete